MGAMKLLQLSHLIYSLDETGLKLIYGSSNWKLLAVKAVKGPQYYSGRRRSRDTAGLHDCKWKQLYAPSGSV